MPFDIESLGARFRRIAPAADQCTLRVVDEQQERITVRQGVAEPPRRQLDCGAMITVVDGDGIGYAARSGRVAAAATAYSPDGVRGCRVPRAVMRRPTCAHST
jgi:predicted Zn-dependent protease